MFTILHISDLHRSPDEPVDNDTLIAGLLADRDRYIGETPIVPSPDAIVVSGDLIQGVPIGYMNWHRIMEDQYHVAGDFLNHLTDRFLGGDRTKLIIIPGNHDVCWNTSFNSMERVPETEYPRDLRAALIQPDSNYRWCWNDRSLYRIRDGASYAKRMDFYWDFVENFYTSIPLFMPIDRTRDYQLFELCNRRIVVAAFDSTKRNDCFGYSGAISRGAVARCNLALRDIPHSYDLRIAVWHHSIQGPPLRDDYMEVGQVEEMAGLHFQLGMHGHQHVAAATMQYVHLSETQSMAVISAGSLCAGTKDLPRGVNRQYNVIVIEDDFKSARIHVREMVEGEQFTRKNSGAFSQGFVKVNWHTTTDIMGRVVDVKRENIQRTILQAEIALHAGRPADAIELLENIELSPDSYPRKIAIQALLKLDDPKLLVQKMGRPHSIEEAVLFASALIRINSLGAARAILADWAGIDSATRRDLECQIQAREIMRSA